MNLSTPGVQLSWFPFYSQAEGSLASSCTGTGYQPSQADLRTLAWALLIQGVG